MGARLARNARSAHDQSPKTPPVDATLCFPTRYNKYPALTPGPFSQPKSTGRWATGPHAHGACRQPAFRARFRALRAPGPDKTSRRPPVLLFPTSPPLPPAVSVSPPTALLQATVRRSNFGSPVIFACPTVSSTCRVATVSDPASQRHRLSREASYNCPVSFLRPRDRSWHLSATRNTNLASLCPISSSLRLHLYPETAQNASQVVRALETLRVNIQVELESQTRAWLYRIGTTPPPRLRPDDIFELMHSMRTNTMYNAVSFA